MNKQRKLKRELGEGYCFTQTLSYAAVERLLKNLYAEERVLEVATLQVGFVRLDALLYWAGGSYQLGYDLMVKDTEDSLAWLCYESLPESTRFCPKHLEQEMFRVLDKAVEQFGLSYTQCRFPVVSGAEGKPK